MFDLFGSIEEWIRELLTDFISSNLTTMFIDVNDRTGSIAAEVGQTPQDWNAGIFSMIRNLSDSVIIPIAGLIITFVLCYELITMITERNNMHDMDTWMFFKWFFKAFIAVFLVTNTFNIVMAIFDVGQSLVNSAAGAIRGSTTIDIASTMSDMADAMETMGIGELLQLTLETALVSMCMKIISILITVILYGRMIEIYLYCSVSPVPFATLTNREWGQIGNNYARGLLALALMSSGVTDSSLKYHLENAKNHGVTRKEIAAVITHVAFYAGWPKGWAVFHMAKEVWTDELSAKGTSAEDARSAHAAQMIFPIGEPNDAFAQYFVGQSYLAPVSIDQVGIYNVTFEPGCRNNWHIHHADNGGGQILVCVAGRGYYQEWGKDATLMKPGDCINIPAGVKHWHGAAPDSWFSHLAIEVPGENGSNEWLEALDDEQYGKLK